MLFYNIFIFSPVKDSKGPFFLVILNSLIRELCSGSQYKSRARVGFVLLRTICFTTITMFTHQMTTLYKSMYNKNRDSFSDVTIHDVIKNSLILSDVINMCTQQTTTSPGLSQWNDLTFTLLKRYKTTRAHYMTS